MRYNQIRECDIANGEGIGVALFVQGCHFKCKNCFNPETWDFNGGKEWTQEVEDKFIELASKPYIKRISLLGGECLADENLDGILNLVNKLRLLFPNKSIWLYSGFTWNTIWDDTLKKMIENGIGGLSLSEECENTLRLVEKRRKIISLCDVMVDDKYIDSQRNPSKKWAGSDNQRVISIQESIKQGKVVLYCD